MKARRWYSPRAREAQKPRAPSRPETPRPLPDGWRPHAWVEEHIASLGFDVAGVLSLYREDKQGMMLKRWGERTFFSWFEIAKTAGRLPRDPHERR